MSQSISRKSAVHHLFTGLSAHFWIRTVAISGMIGCLVVAQIAFKSNRPLMMLIAVVAAVALLAGWMLLEEAQVTRIGWVVWRRFAAAVLMLVVIEAGYRIVDSLEIKPDAEAQAAAARSAKVVTYTEAKGDPVAFQKWWDVYVAEWYRNAELIQTSTPGVPVPYEFKPNTSRRFFRGELSVNSLGLCDREVPIEKGDKYRIVVMGSSHTQCAPIEADDTTWPAKLERLIHERIPNSQRIEVLNAGASAYSMENNLHRLKTVVLPLKPDMIITYFGYNDYKLFQKEFRLPAYPPQLGKRASVLFSKIELRYKTWLCERMAGNEPLDDLAALQPRLEQCRIARLYEEYLRITREAGIQLVVCNFNMAVDEQSPPDVVRFYGQGFTHVKFMIGANRLNSTMLPLVIRPETGAKLIDVQDKLNGVWEGPYVDLVHLSESGKSQLAENVFTGIAEILSNQVPDSDSSINRVAEVPEKAPSTF
jgi:lysophospholipase L1-like esterase